MKLSRRETNLLYVLFSLGTIVAFLVLIIFPLQQSINVQKNQNLTLSDQKALIDAQIANGVNLDSQLITALENVNAEIEKIESPITSEEFELRLQPFLLSNDIHVLSWITNEPVVSSPNLPLYQKSSLVYKLQELIDNYNQVNSSPNMIPSTESQLVKTTLVVTFTSSYTIYTGFIDAIANMNSTVYISSANRDSVTGTATFYIDIYTIANPVLVQP